MNPRQRKFKILETVVESYVEYGEPVGSKRLAEAMNNAFSSATIRNDMADLVEKGYLEQPHTSAGRIPSQRGYRLYVDQLMWKRVLTPEDQQSISSSLIGFASNPERFIQAASMLLAEQTGMAAMITTPADSQARVTGVEVMATGRHTLVLLMMISPSVLKSRICRVDVELDSVSIALLRHSLQKNLYDMPLSALQRGYMARIIQGMAELGPAFAPVFAAAEEMAAEAWHVQLVIEGVTNLIDREDLPYNDAKEVVAFLRNKENILQLLLAPGTTKVLIGRETHCAQLAQVSIVASRYYSGVDAAGWVGVIGPTRMNYARIIPHVEYFAGVVGMAMRDALYGI